MPRTKCVKYGDRSFSAAAPKLWNTLPDDLRICDNLSTFKMKLKTFLFIKHFNIA